MELPLVVRDADHRSEPVVDLRPVDEGDIARIPALGVVARVEDAPEVPKIVRARSPSWSIEDRSIAPLERLRVPVGPAQLLARPERGRVVAPERVLLGPLDRMVLVR